MTSPHASAQIFWRDSVLLPTPQGPKETERLHARRMFYGKPRYDIVQVRGSDGQLWYGRLLAFFDVKVGPAWRRMALLHWLEVTHPTHVPGAVTYRYWGQNPDVVSVATIRHRVCMLTSPRSHGEAQDVCFVLLAYGKWASRER